MVLRPVTLAAVFWSLAEELRLQREDVVEHAIDAPPFEAVVGDHSGALEVFAQRRSKRPVDARLAPDLGFLEQLQAAIERELAGPVALDLHVSLSPAPRPPRRA